MLDTIFDNLTRYTFLFVLVAGLLLIAVIYRKKFFNYFKESWGELKKTSWPSWNRVRELFFVVVVISLIFSMITGVFDFAFTKVFEKILNIS
jgi:preprotein translocase SecE subunit